MPRLLPDELQAARVRSGRLGGRPRKPTIDEARSDALERLLPAAIRVLEEHLDSGRPDAWRSALRVLEHGWGRPPEHVPSTVPDIADVELDDIKTMSSDDLAALLRARPRDNLDGGEPVRESPRSSPDTEVQDVERSAADPVLATHASRAASSAVACR